MKTFVKNSENVLLTIVTLIAMYFIGHAIVGLFQSLVAYVWQDETVGIFSLATLLPAIPANVKLKDIKDIKPLPFDYTIVTTSTNKEAFKLEFKDNNERNMFLGLARIANILTFNYGFSKEHKTQLVGLLVNPSTDSFVKGYSTMTANKAMKIGVESLAERQKAKEEKKAAKVASKGTAKGSNSVASAKIQALKDLFNEGLISAEVLADKIASIQ